MRYTILLLLAIIALSACGGTTYYREPAPEQDSLRVWVDIATTAYQQGDAETAVLYFDRAASTDATFPGVYYNLGLAYSMQGDTLNAAASFRRHIEQQPGDDAPWRALGTLAMQQRKPLEALNSYRKALALAPEQPRNLLGAGRASYLTGDVISALGYLEHAHAVDPADADIACSLGLLYMETDREEEGREMLREAARLGSSEALDFLAQ